MADDIPQEAGLEPPIGMLTGRIDDKGRLKLPADMIEYFKKLKEKSLYVTSLDGRMAQVYLMSDWRQNEKFFEVYRDKPKLSQQVAFLAAALGAPAEMDAQGRIQLPVKLRKQLGLDEGGVHLYSYRGRIQVMSEALYQEKFGAALEGGEDKVYELEAAGLR